MRRFPAPWTVEPLDAGYKVVDANGQVLAYVYGIDDSRGARIAKGLTRNELGASPATSPSCQACWAREKRIQGPTELSR
jgi:hypothetical protein